MKIMRGQSGFTLVELAIVLVIIGIILGAVLKGQELINNAKIKRAYNQYREVLAGVYTYYDKYGRYPGDDNTAATRWPNIAENGNNNGLIENLTLNCDAGVTNNESCQAWLHMRLANILTGSTTQSPSHAYGGGIGIGQATVLGQTRMWIAFQNMPGDVCQSLDQQYDDGVYNTGGIIGSGDYNNYPNATYNLNFRL